MTAVTLTTVWLNDAADPSDALRCRAAAGLTRTPAARGRQQGTAGGGLRFVRRPRNVRSWELSLPMASAAEQEWLEAHVGRTVTARDQFGHKIHAFYTEAPVEHMRVGPRGGVELELVEVDHDEEV